MTRGARLAVAWLLLLLLAQCAATPEGPPPPGSLDEDDADDGAEDDEADLPPSPPVIAGEELRSRLPRLSALLPLASGTLPSSMSWLKAGAVTSATTLSRTVLAVRPFLSDPTRLVRLPTRIKVFVVLLAVSVFSLIQVLTGVMTIIMSPARAVARLCVGTFCFHLAFLVLRREEQLRRLTSVERMPYTMTTGVTMLAAAWAAAENKRLGSYLFGALHLFAFSLDAFSHIPGGKRVATWLIKAYLSFFRWLLALVGIKIEPPAWMRHAVAGKELSELAATEAAAASTSSTSTWLRTLQRSVLPSFATRASKPADAQAAAAKAAAAGASQGATELASRAVATQAVFVPRGALPHGDDH
jgi:hypothetical protein